MWRILIIIIVIILLDLLNKVIGTLEESLKQVETVANTEYYNCSLNDKGFITEVAPTNLVKNLPMNILNGCHKIENFEAVQDEMEYKRRVLE